MGPGWHLWVRGVTYGSAPHLPTADGSFGPRLLELCNRGLLLMGLGGHLWGWDGTYVSGMGTYGSRNGTYGSGMGTYGSRIALMGL